jgi:hypothetical protein
MEMPVSTKETTRDTYAGSEIYITTIIAFLLEKEIRTLLLVTKTIGSLVTDSLHQTRHIHMVEAMFSFGRHSNNGPISYIGGVQDLRSLGLVCKCLHPYGHDTKTVARMMGRNLDCVLERFGFCRWTFSSMLQFTSSIIGGSVILQCARGEIYDHEKGSDIDIYVPFEHEGDVYQFLVNNNYALMGSFEYSLQSPEMEFIRGVYQNQEVGYNSYQINHVVKCTHLQSSLKVDIVIMNEHVKPRCAIAGYDLTFCMSLYDGAQFELWFPMDIIERQGRYNAVRSFAL